jgi:hypothetical protein
MMVLVQPASAGLYLRCRICLDVVCETAGKVTEDCDGLSFRGLVVRKVCRTSSPLAILNE